MLKHWLAVAAMAGVAHTAAADPLVSPQWLRAHLHDAGITVLDLRPGTDYVSGHIPGSIGADYEHSGWRVSEPGGAKGALPPVADIAARIGALGVGDETHAVIVGDDFGAAARIYWTFKVLGHTDVSILDGGWSGWAADAADPVDASKVTPLPAMFSARYDPTIRADAAEIESALATGDETLLDARPPGQWSGTAKAPTVARYGHLPGAVWIDQSEALRSSGALKPEAELEQRFAGVGDKPVTAYCNTGHLAATDWFVLSEVLHKPGTKLYDRSLSEWASDPSRPVVRE